jgi:putative transposase
MKYKFISEHSSIHSVKKMCHVLSLSRSGYYNWKNFAVSLRKQENNKIKKEIQQIYNDHCGRIGSPMITPELRERDWPSISKNRVARLMKEMGLRCKVVKAYKVTTNSKHSEPVAANLLDRNFTVGEPDVVWVTDITYIKVANSWMYLTVFIDLFSRIVVGWTLSNSLRTEGVVGALLKGVWKRKAAKGLMIHSDRGCQYASKEFREHLKHMGFIQSMSRKGNCWDNAVAESFFHTLKNELVYQTKFRNQEEAHSAIFEYIEIYYN